MGTSYTPGRLRSPGDREKPPAFPAVDPLVGVSLAALDRDERHPGIGFHVADQRRHVKQAIGFQFRGHVTRFAAPVGHRLDERALFSANVAAGADEHGNQERTTQHSGVHPANSEFFRPSDLGAAGFDLLGVFVSNINEPLRRLGQHPATMTASTTVWGLCRRISRSLKVPGSLSSPLTTMNARSSAISRRRRSRTASRTSCHF